MRLSVGTAVLLVSLAASSSSAQLPGAGDRPGVMSQVNAYIATVRSQVEAAATTLKLTWDRQNAGELASLHAKDAVLIAGADDVIRSRKEIQRHLQRVLPRIRSIALTFEDFQTSGDVAYLVGGITMDVVQPEGGVLKRGGTYSILFRRHWSGSWEIQSFTLPLAGVLTS